MRPGEPVLPTVEAHEAGQREREWLAGNPAVAESERAERERVYAERTRADQEQVRLEWQRRATHRPPQFESFKSRDWLSLLTRRWLSFVVVLTVAAGVFELLQLGILGGLTESEYPDADELVTNDGWLGVIYLLMFLAWVVAAGLFIAWLFRAYKNVQALGARQMRFANGWAIGGWFVPILSLWRPKQVVNDVWRASDTDLPADAPSAGWVERPVPTLLTLWWAFFITGEVLTRVTLRTSTATLSEARTAVIIDLVASGVQLVTGILAIRLVTLTTRRMRARAERVAALPPLPAEELAVAQ